jgi:hypothetical protein
LERKYNRFGNENTIFGFQSSAFKFQLAPLHSGQPTTFAPNQVIAGGARPLHNFDKPICSHKKMSILRTFHDRGCIFICREA